VIPESLRLSARLLGSLLCFVPNTPMLPLVNGR
jgi:hypothetical protein